MDNKFTEERWLICADPDSCQIYTLNIITNEFQIEYDVDQEYRQKAIQAIQQIEQMLKLKTGTWLMASKQIEQYRRRKIPYYLLHKQSSSIPTYLCQSTLSQAFVKVNSIKLQVKLNQYKELFINMSPEVQLIEKPNIVEIEAGLVTGADEVIKNVLREIYQRFKVKLKPKVEKNQFILQIAGFKEFLTGNHPMLSYDRVRVQLRGMKHLEVILTEVPKQTDQSSLFPPIVQRIKGADQHPPINWKKFKDVPILLWYAPSQLPKYESEMINTRLSFGLGVIHQFKSEKVRAYSQENISNFEGSEKVKKQQLEVSSQKCLSQDNGNKKGVGYMNDLVSMRNELSRKNILQIDQNILYSGECDWPFSVRICSIENLVQILEQDNKFEKPQLRATYNGLIPPKYITKKTNTKIEDDAHKKNNKPEDRDQNKGRQVHLKLHKRTGRVLDPRNLDIHKQIPIGGQDFLDELETFQERFELDFLPFLISVQVSLYHGCKLLTPWCQAETKKQPFSHSPKFYQSITFPGIKISQLPQEARLCFNILAHSAIGQQQIIGCTTMYIFSEEKRFRAHMNSLNVWPFYKIDPRLLCVGQYYGWVNSQSTQITSDIITNSYGRVIIQLDQFNLAMKWSLRDEKQLEELGFSKSARSQRYYEMRNTLIPNSDYSTYQQMQSSTLASEQIGTLYQSNYSTTANSFSSANNFNIGSHIFNKKQRAPVGGNAFYANNNIHQRQHTNPYEQYAQVGFTSQDQGTNLRFGELNERNNHLAPSVMHMGQGSSFNIHEQSSTQFSSYKLSHQISQQNITQNQPVNESYNQIFTFKNWSTTPRTEDLAILQALLKYNPLNRPYFTDQHKYILMICRNHYKTLPYALQIFLMAIEWDDPEQVREAHNMIKLWTPLPPEDALPLLDAPFADETVRLYAVERVSILSDDELQLYMLELTQCLMFEKHLFNPLAEMLLERSLQNPWVVGHELFWLLKAQLHVRPSYERYSLLLEQLLMLCGEFRQQLMNEVLVDNELYNIAQKVKEENIPKDNRVQFLQAELNQLFPKLPKPFSFALDSRMEAQQFKMSECKVMDSKKMPLWLSVIPQCIEDDEDLMMVQPQKIVKANEDGIIQLVRIILQWKFITLVNIIQIAVPDDSKQGRDLKEHANEQQHIDSKQTTLLKIMFKVGDDIRQDMLTLQLIKIMDKIWLDAGLDFRMKPYKTISTQDNVGMIEVVTNSLTIEKIHGDAGVMGAFQQKTIWNHLKTKNTEPQSFETATDNFLRSCAGYCVATYVLGIGDRHSGNIMITDTGHLFHIDFGHFLGNFKQKFGIKRERTKFVLTEEMAFVMGGRDGDLFKKFQQDCTNAYNLVRKHGHFLINIFLMNLSAGMPELQKASNVKYIEDQLALNISDQEATAKFKQEIIISLNDTWRQIDNWFHYIKRRGG